MILTALVAGMLAVAPPANAALKKVKKPANNGYVTTTKKKESKAYCISVATTYNFSKSLDAHAKAITDAVVYACKNPPKDKYWWTYVYEKMKDPLEDVQGGFAFAQAIATAESYCRTEGNAWGCAAAYAHAQAWTEASIKAHASAWSKALAECDCDKAQTVYADASNYAYVAEKLTAKVDAVAESHVCADGDDEQYDYDAQTCVQDIYAVAWAKSISKAVISGFCFPPTYYDESTSGGLIAVAEAEAEVDIETTEIKGCVGYVDHYYSPQYLAYYRE